MVEGLPVTIQHTASVSPDELADLRATIAGLGYQARLKSTDLGPQNAVEWALPAVVAVLIAKPFFDAFFKELGKSAAGGLKQALSDVIRKFKGREQLWKRRSSPDPRHSPLLTLTLVVRGTGEAIALVPTRPNGAGEDASDDLTIEFIFPADVGDCDPEELERALSAIPTVVAREEAIQNKYPFLRRTLLMYGYSRGKGQWVPDDHYERLVKMYRERGVLADDEPKLP
jgi:hypothetical protein